MAYRHDENLPEVVPDSSPQTLTSAEVYQRMVQEGEKYTIVYDKDTPKFVASGPFVGDVETPAVPAPAYQAPASGAAVAGDAKGAVAVDVEDLGRSVAGSEKKGPKTFVLKRRTLIIVVIIAVILIAAGIGGGVGGSQAAAKQKASVGGASDSADSAGLAEGASSPSTTTGSGAEEGDNASSAGGSSSTQSGSGTSDDDESSNDKSDDDKSDDDESGGDKSGEKPAKPSPTPSPKPTSGGSGGGSGGSKDKDDKEEEEKDDSDNRPKPGFSFRGWKGASYKGQATDVILTTGFLDLPFDVTSYKWEPKGTDCCVTMCQGKREDVGWRCTSFNREKATANFDRIFIGCGAEASQESSRCA